MFPTGVITREVSVGPAFDRTTGEPYSVRVMVAPTRSALWRATGDPVVSKLKTYTIAAGQSDTIVLPVTDQNGYTNGRGEDYVLDTGEHAFGYVISTFYLNNGAVVRTLPSRTVTIPSGESVLDIDNLIALTDEYSGAEISVPDIWSSQIAAAQAAAELAAASAAAALISSFEVSIDDDGFTVLTVVMGED